MRTLDYLMCSGKVRHRPVGRAPVVRGAQSIAEFRGYEPIAAIQLEYSLAQRAIEDDRAIRHRTWHRHSRLGAARERVTLRQVSPE
jgi:aryl-alcohol dehydrogenase-like predicted oxidoreductase